MIRNKNADIIRAIKKSGCTCKDITLESLEVTENDTYTAEEGKAWNEVTVNVESGGGDTPSLTIKEFLQYISPNILSKDGFLIPDYLYFANWDSGDEPELTLFTTYNALYDFLTSSLVLASGNAFFYTCFSTDVSLPSTGFSTLLGCNYTVVSGLETQEEWDFQETKNASSQGWYTESKEIDGTTVYIITNGSD